MSFVPGLPGGGYLLATNRDESPRRGEALPPEELVVGGRRVLAPRDADQGGTWIGIDEHGACLCVLNGDRPAAAPAPDDATSRGLLVRELLADARPAAVERELERRAATGRLRVRPFKLVVIERGRGGAAARWRRCEWDGAVVRWQEPSEAPELAVSSTFRPDEVAAARGAAWSTWLAGSSALRAAAARGEPGTEEALAAALQEFHAGHAPGAPQGDAFGVCMHRDDARTVSRTLARVSATSLSLTYTPNHPCKVSGTRARFFATLVPGNAPN